MRTAPLEAEWGAAVQVISFLFHSLCSSPAEGPGGEGFAAPPHPVAPCPRPGWRPLPQPPPGPGTEQQLLIWPRATGLRSDRILGKPEGPEESRTAHCSPSRSAHSAHVAALAIVAGICGHRQSLSALQDSACQHPPPTLTPALGPGASATPISGRRGHEGGNPLEGRGVSIDCGKGSGGHTGPFAEESHTGPRP